MWVVINVIRVLLAVLALRSNRWAYVAFMALGLLYFPLRVNFRFDPHPRFAQKVSSRTHDSLLRRSKMCIAIGISWFSAPLGAECN